MVSIEDLLDLKFDGIEFCDNKFMTVEECVKGFQNELNKIGVQYFQNSNDEVFKPLRKFYASGLRFTLLGYYQCTTGYNNSVISNDFLDIESEYLNKGIFVDENIKKIKGLGIKDLEFHYYDKYIHPRILSEVYTKFFINLDNDYLANSIDRDPVENIGKYFQKYFSAAVNISMNTKKSQTEEILTPKILEKYLKLFDDAQWIKEYNSKISKIYSYPYVDFYLKNFDKEKKREERLNNILDFFY